MRPKTMLQKEVIAYRLPRLTGEQRQYIKDKLFKHYLYKTKQHTTCLACGHRWDTPKEPLLAAALLGDTCPKCGRTLSQYSNGKKRVVKESAHVCHITTYKNFQIFRYWFVERKCKVLDKAEWDIWEVQQEWIREDGKRVDIARLVNSFNYGQNWQRYSFLEIRRHGYDIQVDKHLPKRKILKVLRRNGFKGNTYNLIPSFFCSVILSDPKAETLLKSKQINLLNNIGRYENKIERYWPSIKIAIRHSFTVTDASDWFDHLELLERFDRDILNPSLICPDDFTTEHQRLVDKRNRIEAKRRYEEKKAKLDKDNVVFTKEKGKYFDLEFTKGDITVRPLTHVKEFYEEAEILHHCVSSYYSKEDSLILTAQKNGERLETVEVHLPDFSVAQSRGLQNRETKHHKEIVSLVESNMNKIKKTAKKQKA